jgi:CHAT domain-containing protein
MTGFYRRLETDSTIGKAGAIRQAQLALLQGKYETLEEALKVWSDFFDVQTGNALNQPKFKKDPQAPFAHPFYWSPFVLIGNWK